MLYGIRRELGFGSVNNFPSARGNWRYAVSDKEGIDRLIHLFNGNLLLDKVTNRFSHWLNLRNTRSKLYPSSMGHSIERLSDPMPTGELIRSTGWLSGFTDAEGCFVTGKLLDSRHKAGFRIRFRYILDQKGEKPTLLAVQSWLNSGHLKERTTLKEMWRFTVTDRGSCREVLNYLKQHPLRGEKAIHALRWGKILQYVEEQASRPWEGKSLARLERLIAKTEEVDGTLPGVERDN